ncbi:formin-J-like isoform X2 [Condylostylus longicornis]|uniref:formin-J-like isoform X2 n=1 Tax=Condylostylus longicornis TaxID=2530218 RepID=UPI00244DA387|nr:formin-J-like isoform X2 [Condylostylus longicornis]
MDTTCLGGGRRKKEQKQEIIEKEIFTQSKNETVKQQELKESEEHQYQNYPSQYHHPYYQIEEEQNWDLQQNKNQTDIYYPEHYYDNELHQQKIFHHQHQHYYQNQNQIQLHPCYRIDHKDIIEKKENQKQKHLNYTTEQIIMNPLSPQRNSSNRSTNNNQNNNNNNNSSSNNSTNSSTKSLQLNQNLLQQSPKQKHSPEILSTSATITAGAMNKNSLASNISTSVHPSIITPTSTIPFVTPSSNLTVSIASSPSSTDLDFTNNIATCGRDNNESSELLDRTKPSSSEFLMAGGQIKSNIISSKSKNQQKQIKIQQKRYPILDLDAIEVCNEQESALHQQQQQQQQQQPLHFAQQMSLIKSLRGKKSQQLPSSNIKNYNYNLMGTNESCSSSQSSNSGCGYNAATLEANVKWSHNLPITSGASFNTDTFFGNNEIIDDIPLQHPHPFHHDYSYAYYEPGAAMRHSNIPTPEQQDVSESPNRPPPPNSIRALLSKGKKHKILVSPAVRQSYQAKIASSLQENFYEEIESETKGGCSQTSKPPSGAMKLSMVEEEFRRVQSNHRKILGELNLSVEAMLMPKTPPNISPTGKETSPILQHISDISSSSSSQSLNNRKGNNKSKTSKPNKSADNIDELLNAPTQCTNIISSVSSGISNTISFCVASNTCSIGEASAPPIEVSNTPSSNILSSTCAGNTDLDSGFSGSSGASYIGSLRYHKTNAALSNIISSKKLLNTTKKTGNDQILKEDVQETQNHEKSNQKFSVSFSESNFSTISEQLTKNSRSSQRSNQTNFRNLKGNIEVTSGNNKNNSNCNPFIIQSSHGKKILNFSKLSTMEQINSKVTTPTESKARSFWAKKGWKKSQTSASTSSIDQAGKGKKL